MNWKKLNSQQILEDIKKASFDQPVLLFKHSTRCSVSSMALNRLERAWKDAEMASVEPYYLDLIANRDISNKIAADFGVEHQSPQVLLIQNGECVFDASHMNISYNAIVKAV